MFFQTFNFMRKDFHILANLFFCYSSINLGSPDIGMAKHTADGFDGNSLGQTDCCSHCVPCDMSKIGKSK